MKKNMRHLFTSHKQDWATPQRIFDELDAEFHFTFDACANSRNAKTVYYCDYKSLEKRWTGSVFCNPPYGKDLGLWIAHGYREAKAGATVVMLLPARTDTIWFHEFCLEASEIRFIKGRLRFDDGDGRATFPSMIVIFQKE